MNRINLSITQVIGFEIDETKPGPKPIWWQCRLCRPHHRRQRAANADIALEKSEAHLIEMHHATLNSTEVAR